jgi:hypothetical protein
MLISEAAGNRYEPYMWLIRVIAELKKSMITTSQINGGTSNIDKLQQENNSKSYTESARCG